MPLLLVRLLDMGSYGVFDKTRQIAFFSAALIDEK